VDQTVLLLVDWRKTDPGFTPTAPNEINSIPSSVAIGIATVNICSLVMTSE
jgi:hypothetical protein